MRIRVLLLGAIAACHEGSPRGTSDLVDSVSLLDAGSDAPSTPDTGTVLHPACSETSPCALVGSVCVDQRCVTPPGPGNPPECSATSPCALASDVCVDQKCRACAPHSHRCQNGPGGDRDIVCSDDGVEMPGVLCAGQTSTCLPGLGCTGLRSSCAVPGVLGADSCPINGSSPSCCTITSVSYEEYNRLNDSTLPATIGNFELNRFEVTVGRFRRFVEDGRGTNALPPVDASGENPRRLGTAWDPIWKAELPIDGTALRTAIASCPGSTWTPTASAREYQPITCVSWYEAFAFCIWDGGRLPSEAEWNSAASDGPSQRVYPWSNPASNESIDGTRARYASTGPKAVGNFVPAGDTALQISDLAGNVAEWTFDGFLSPPPTPCVDCSVTCPSAMRVVRGGSWKSSAVDLRNDQRTAADPASRSDAVGFRCAYP